MKRNQCQHKNLVLLNHNRSEKVRCNHCHLTIDRNELGKNHCPECFETSGTKHYDFEPVSESKQASTQYRCENCGILIQCNDAI